MNHAKKRPSVYVFTTAYHPFIGGAEIAIEQIARRLSKEFNFFIVTARMDRLLSRREARPEGTVIRLGFGNRFDKFLLPILSLIQIGSKPDILFGLDISTGSVAATALKVFFPRKQFIFNIQYGYGDDRITRGRFGLINIAFRIMLRRADTVVAISSYLLELARRFGHRGIGMIIPNGVDIEQFKNTTKNTDQKTPTVITASRLVNKNGIDVLIRSIAELKKSIPNIRGIVVGDGPERDYLRRMACDLQLGNHIEFRGDIPYVDLPRHFQGADVFARPSRSEGLGIAFLDAMAAGVPVVGTAVGGIPDIICDGETGFFAKVDDPIDLAEKIKILLADKQLSDRIVAEGQKYIAARFTWRSIAEQYGALFANARQIHPRVLITTGIYPPDIGGPATYSKLLFEELPKQGISVEVLSFGEVRRYPPGIRHFLYFLKVLWRGRHADIIFAQDPVSVGLPVSIAAFVARKKFLLKVVGDFAWEQGTQRFGVREVLDEFLKKKYRWRVELLRKIQKWSANRAQKIIVPSEYLKRVVSKWGVDAKKIVVVYNAFDKGESIESGYKEKARQDFNLDKEEKIIISAGRLVPWKGFDALIDVMPDILRQCPNAKLWIVGDGPERKNLESKINYKGLKENVVLFGSLPRYTLLTYCFIADVFVLNTAYEGFSHQILEAMYLGTPVITTRVGGNPEVITDGTDGFLVPYNDTKAFQEKISLLFRFPESYSRITKNARERAKTFNRERMIEGTINILKKL